MPFDRCLFVDADMVWCSNPEPLWQRLEDPSELAHRPFLAAALSGRSWGDSDLYRYYRPPLSPETVASAQVVRGTVLPVGAGSQQRGSRRQSPSAQSVASESPCG